MKASEVANLIKPFALRWIEQAQAQSRSGAPSPHDLASSHHTGSLADSQAPQFLKLDGSRPLLASLMVADGATIDGVDLSAHADDPAAHHLPFVGLLDGFGTPIDAMGEYVTVTSTNPHVSTISDVAALLIALDNTHNPGASSRLLSTDSTGKIQLTGLTLTGDLALNGGKLTSTGDLVLDLTGKDVLPNVGYDLNIGARLKPFLSAHIAELQVGTLVAREEIATIGGSLFVAPTNILAADLAASGTGSSSTAPSRQALGTYSSGSGTSSTVAVQVPAAATVGNLAIVPVVYRSNTIGITGVPSGWDLRGTPFVHAASGQTIALYSRVLTSADVTTPRPTYTWTLSGAIAALGAMVCVKDFDPSDPYDIDVIWKQGTSGTNVVADSQTTTVNNTYYLFFGVSAANCTFTHPGGMTEVLDIATTTGGSNIALNIAEEARTTAGATGSRTAVASVSANTMSVVLAISPAPTGAITSPISVKYNNFLVGDTLVMKKNGLIEFMRVETTASGTGPYTYTVTRDLDGTGLNAWVAGDAVLNTLQTGKGWLEMYAEYSTKSSSQEGPTIVANVRNSSTYNDWTPRAAFGRLKNLYDYSTGDPYGVAFGNPTATWLGIDDTNGFRIMNAATRIAQWEADGDIKLGPTNALQLNADGSAAFTGSITFGGGTHVGDATGLNVYASGNVNIYRAHDDSGLGGGVIVRDTMTMPGTVAGTIRRIMEVNTNSVYNRAELQISAGRSATTDSYLLLGTQGVGATLMSTERLTLASYNRTGYIHVPLVTPATSANWNATNKAIVGWTEINLASEFGLPTQIKGVFVRLVGTATATGGHDLSLSSNASNACMSLRAFSTTVPDDESGFIPCNASGNIHYIVRGTAFNSVSLLITGYLI